MKLQKFENVDVIASLEAIMKQNTAFYQDRKSTRLNSSHQ